jgi:hypothetical protein
MITKTEINEQSASREADRHGICRPSYILLCNRKNVAHKGICDFRFSVDAEVELAGFFINC